MLEPKGQPIKLWWSWNLTLHANDAIDYCIAHSVQFLIHNLHLAFNKLYQSLTDSNLVLNASKTNVRCPLVLGILMVLEFRELVGSFSTEENSFNWPVERELLKHILLVLWWCI